MKRKVGGVIAGLLLIALAVFMVLGSLGIGFNMPADIQVWQWIVGGFLLLALFDGIRKLEFVQTFLMLGFEVMVFEPQLGALFGFAEKNWISNWLVFFVSLLVGIGFSMIFKGFAFATVKIKKNTLGSTVKYIDCTDFKKEVVENKLGNLEVRFENVCPLEGDAVLEVHNSLGDTNVYIPAEWNVKVNLINTLGDISVDEAFMTSNTKKGRILEIEVTEGEKYDEPTLTVKVYNKLGETNIRAQ
jgi:predicted membrane protein